eukprot:SAG22_NODE_3812_length_1519_cov_1.821831_1_plen_134_part_00
MRAVGEWDREPRPSKYKDTRDGNVGLRKGSEDGQTATVRRCRTHAPGGEFEAGRPELGVLGAVGQVGVERLLLSDLAGRLVLPDLVPPDRQLEPDSVGLVRFGSVRFGSVRLVGSPVDRHNCTVGKSGQTPVS